jgi:dGTPase
MNLASFACHPEQTRGRRIVEPASDDRTDFQRDRDRIVHCSSFRRLVYKTQVFLNHEGDLFRTRMTHSLEVAQLARSIGRSLGLNEDLIEGIALAHDLGHTPFGHAGQDALNACMADYGGFEHNLQSLRVVDHLEQRYAQFDGLNLCFETREGILKHCSIANARVLEAQEPAYADGGGGIGERFLERQQPSLEAQLCNLADEIAYNAHDVDDGVRAGLISMDQLREVSLFNGAYEAVLGTHTFLVKTPASKRILYESIRKLLSEQVHDVIDSTKTELQMSAAVTVADVRASTPLVKFSGPMAAHSKALKAFLFRNVYRHAHVTRQMDMAQQVVRELFSIYLQKPQEMQTGPVVVATVQDAPRFIADYIAGMTDRFAIREHERLTGLRVIA